MSPQILNTKLLYINEGPERDKNVTNVRVFPKVDHSGNDVRIVLQQNKFRKSYL